MLNLTSFLKYRGQVGFEVSAFGICKKDECKKFHPITTAIIFIVKTRRIQSRCICCFYQQNNCKTFLLQLYKWKLTTQYGGKDNKECCSFWSETQCREVVVENECIFLCICCVIITIIIRKCNFFVSTRLQVLCSLPLTKRRAVKCCICATTPPRTSTVECPTTRRWLKVGISVCGPRSRSSERWRATGRWYV